MKFFQGNKQQNRAKLLYFAMISVKSYYKQPDYELFDCFCTKNNAVQTESDRHYYNLNILNWDIGLSLILFPMKFIFSSNILLINFSIFVIGIKWFIYLVFDCIFSQIQIIILPFFFRQNILLCFDFEVLWKSSRSITRVKT